MKFLIDDKRRLIGAHIAGQCAGEMSFAIPIARCNYALTENPGTAAKIGRFLSKLT
jgi:pyruvate/2-oxoglutarate dehydrogenase complex dihydrolipoamide dehydrogenase (E3) component